MKTIVAMTLRSSQIAQTAAELRIASDGNLEAGLTAHFDRLENQYVFTYGQRYRLVLAILDDAGVRSDLNHFLQVAKGFIDTKDEVRLVAHTLHHRELPQDRNETQATNEYNVALQNELNTFRKAGVPAGYIHHPNTNAKSPDARNDENLTNYFVLLDLLTNLKEAALHDNGEPSTYLEDAWHRLRLPRD